jgi:non-ribosomal peptide synthetase component F
MTKLHDSRANIFSRTIPEIFEQQAKQTPDAVAVMYEGTELTYRDLNENSNRLAHYLLSMGARQGARIGMGYLAS